MLLPECLRDVVIQCSPVILEIGCLTQHASKTQESWECSLWRAFSMLASLSVVDEAHSEAPLMVVLTNISSTLLCDLRQHLTTVKRGASHAA